MQISITKIKKTIIKYFIQLLNKNNLDKSNKKKSILLEDNISSKYNKMKSKGKTSRTNKINNCLKKLYTYKNRYSNISLYPKRNRYNQ